MPETIKSFPLGHLVCTHGVHTEIPTDKILGLVKRHASGDWGVEGQRVFVITEADRSATTVMFASEY